MFPMGILTDDFQKGKSCCRRKTFCNEMWIIPR
nr:MAG TPA: hypothetical protein [Caudoviricetes sp.]